MMTIDEAMTNDKAHKVFHGFPSYLKRGKESYEDYGNNHL